MSATSDMFQENLNDPSYKPIPNRECIADTLNARHPLDLPITGANVPESSHRNHERHPLDYIDCLPDLLNSDEANQKDDGKDSLYTFDEIDDDVVGSEETVSISLIDNRPPFPLPRDESKMVAIQDHDYCTKSDGAERDIHCEKQTTDFYEHHKKKRCESSNNARIFDRKDKAFTSEDFDINFENQCADLYDDHIAGMRNRNSYKSSLSLVENDESFSNNDQNDLYQSVEYENQRSEDNNLPSARMKTISYKTDETDNYNNDRQLSENDKKRDESQYIHEVTRELLCERVQTVENLPEQEEEHKVLSKPPIPAPRKQRMKSKPDLTPRCHLIESGNIPYAKQPVPLQNENSKKATKEVTDISIKSHSHRKLGYENVYDYVLDNKVIFCVKGTPPITLCSQNKEKGIADRILEKRRLIEGYIRVSDILGHLTFLDDLEDVRLKNNESPRKAASLLLDKISKSEEEGKWTTFIDALEKERYSYVVNVINGDSIIAEDDMLARKQLLQVFRPRLVQDLDPGEVTDHLFEKNVINVDDMDEIRREMANKGRKAATYLLLDRIPIRSPTWYCDFLQALRSSGQGFLADEIDDTNRKTTCSRLDRSSKESQASIAYMKYLTPEYKSSSEIHTDEQILCKNVSEEAELHKQLTEMQDKLENKRKNICILKQIQSVKSDLDLAQREEETLLKVIGYEDNSENDNGTNHVTAIPKEPVIQNKDPGSSECEENSVSIHIDELETIMEQADPVIALKILGTKETIRFDDCPSCPTFGLQEIYSQSEQQQLIKIYDASSQTSPRTCLPKPHVNNKIVDSGVFSANLDDGNMLSLVIHQYV